MSSYKEQKEAVLIEMAKLHARHELSENMKPDYFEPGMMEYPEQSDGSWNESTGKLILRFESKGTRYDGRTEQIEKVKAGDVIRVVREPENAFNHNNFILFTEKGKDVGNMPAELCNAIAPLYDDGILVIEGASVSFVEPISKRNRHAKQAVLFVEMHAKIIEPELDETQTDSERGGEELENNSEKTQLPSDAEQYTDPYALHLDLNTGSLSIGSYELHGDMRLGDIRRQVFYENAKEVPVPGDPRCIRVFLPHTTELAGEEWVASLQFENDKFTALHLDHGKLFNMRRLLKNAASSPRLRKERAALYSKLKPRMDDLIGKKGEQVSDGDNLYYTYEFDTHGVMLVQDNILPGVVINVQYAD